MSRTGRAALTIYDVIDGSIPTFTRYYSITPGLFSEMGDPTTPGTGVTWTLASGAAPSTAYWIAENYTIDGVTSAWQVYPVQAKDGGIPFVTHTKVGFNKPTLGSATWITDAVAAASAFTGRTYTNQKEFGYGTTVVITYDDGKLYGRYVQSGGVDTWVAPLEFIDGDLIVDGSIASDKIQANTITATQISADSITATEIQANTITATEIAAGTITATQIAADAITANKIVMDGNIEFSTVASGVQFGKTTLGDTSTGAFFGRSGSVAGFNISSATSGIYADSSGIMSLNNVRLYTGAPGTALELLNPGTYATNLASTTTVISVIIVGAGAGAQNSVPFDTTTGREAGVAGQSSWIEFYSGVAASNVVSGSLLNIGGVTRFIAAGGAAKSYSNGSVSASGLAGQSSSQSGSAGSSGGGDGSKGGGGGGPNGQSSGVHPYNSADVSANAGGTVSQQFTIPSGTQSVKVFVGSGGSGGAAGSLAWSHLQGPDNNVINHTMTRVAGGDGGDGYVSIADPNSGGIEVDLVALTNRITALESNHP